MHTYHITSHPHICARSGGAHGGWTAFRKRWLVLTASGRVSYFKTEKTNKALGQFSLSQVKIIYQKHSESVTTQDFLRG